MWTCPQCKSEIDEDDVVNCWNCDYVKNVAISVAEMTVGSKVHSSVESDQSQINPEIASKKSNLHTRIACISGAVLGGFVPIYFILGLLVGPGIASQDGKIHASAKYLIIIQVVMLLMSIGVYLEKWRYAIILMTLSLFLTLGSFVNGQVLQGFVYLNITVVFAYCARRISIKNNNLTFGLV